MTRFRIIKIIGNPKIKVISSQWEGGSLARFVSFSIKVSRAQPVGTNRKRIASKSCPCDVHGSCKLYYSSNMPRLYLWIAVNYYISYFTYVISSIWDKLYEIQQNYLSLLKSNKINNPIFFFTLIEVDKIIND